MSRFIDNKDGTVTDVSTGLIWQREHADKMNWKEARKYATNTKLRLGGYKDWRLPTPRELFGLVDHSRVNPATAFPKTPPDWFWTSVSYTKKRKRLSSYAWGVNFCSGSVGCPPKNNSYYVRCVRGKEKKKGKQ